MKGAPDYEKVATAFMCREPATSGNFVSNGDTLYSYNRLLSEWTAGNLYTYLDKGWSSKTTDRHIAALKRAAGLA